MPNRRSHVTRGLMAGFLAATALALFFLVIDWLAGAPFRTPAFLAAALAGADPQTVGIGLIIAYTVLHYAIFLLVGVVMAWLLDRMPVLPGFLLGIALGVLFFDVVFYASVVITGVNVVEALGWAEVLIGNVLAGIVLMGYFHLRGEAPVISWWEALRDHQIIREGLIGGLLAATAVAIWFLIFDIAFRNALFTPAALGSAVFYGATSPEQVQITAASVLGYTIVHFAAFVLVGLIAAAIAVQAETNPPLVLVFIEAFVVLEALFIGLLAIFAVWIPDTLGWWNVIIGNVIAAGMIVGYFWHEHPGVPRSLRRTIERPA